MVKMMIWLNNGLNNALARFINYYPDPEIHRHSSFRKYYDWVSQLNKEKY